MIPPYFHNLHHYLPSLSITWSSSLPFPFHRFQHNFIDSDYFTTFNNLPLSVLSTIRLITLHQPFHNFLPKFNQHCRFHYFHSALCAILRKIRPLLFHLTFNHFLPNFIDDTVQASHSSTVRFTDLLT